jgi:hypothetical protein
MALEDRFRTSVDQAVQALVSDLLTIHNDVTARQLDEAEERVRETERARNEIEQQLAAAEADRQVAIDAAVVAAVEAERTRLMAETDERMQALYVERDAAIAEAEARAVAETKASIDAVRIGEREAEIAGFTRLVESVRGLDGATSLSEVLDALARAAAREAARAAVVVVKGDHVVGWRLSGFGARDAQPKSVYLPLAEAGVIGMAASSSRAATTQNGSDGPGFEHLPVDRMGLAMPVLVGGRVVAVVYADGVSGAEEEPVVPNPWPEAIEVLARHAGRCLEALTAQKTGAPVRVSAALGATTPSVAPATSGTPATSGATG